MTGQNLYDQVIKLNGNSPIDQTFVLQLLNIAKTNRESLRKFKYLLKIDTTQTASPSDTWLTPKSLPSDFLLPNTKGKIILYNSAKDTSQVYTEIPFEDRVAYKNDNNKYYVDYQGGKYYLTGKPDDNYAIHFPYFYDSADIAVGTTWATFPARFHPILAFDSIAMWRMGTDYDDINARNANDNARMAELLFEAMKKWDQELALSAVENIEYPMPLMSGTFQGRRLPPSELRR